MHGLGASGGTAAEVRVSECPLDVLPDSRAPCLTLAGGIRDSAQLRIRVGTSSLGRGSRCPPGPYSQAPSAATSCPALHPASFPTDCPSTTPPTTLQSSWRLRPLPHCGNAAWPGTEVSAPAPSHLRGGPLPFLVFLPPRSLPRKAPSGREERAQALVQGGEGVSRQRRPASPRQREEAGSSVLRPAREAPPPL